MFTYSMTHYLFEKTLQKNDVNFLVGVNLLNAWHGNSKTQSFGADKRSSKGID